jgi:chromosomal replication initiator protein
MSFPEIARAMGRPNHSSVITAYRRIEGQMAAGMAAGLAPGSEFGALSLKDLASQLEDRLVRGAAPA